MHSVPGALAPDERTLRDELPHRIKYGPASVINPASFSGV